MFHKGSIKGSKQHIWVSEAQIHKTVHIHGTLKLEAFKLLKCVFSCTHCARMTFKKFSRGLPSNSSLDMCMNHALAMRTHQRACTTGYTVRWLPLVTPPSAKQKASFLHRQESTASGIST